MDTIVQQLTNTVILDRTITQEQYEAWQREYTFDALRGQKYGVSFCEHFGVLDYRIYYDSTPETCDRIIRKEWIV